MYISAKGIYRLLPSRLINAKFSRFQSIKKERQVNALIMSAGFASGRNLQFETASTKTSAKPGIGQNRFVEPPPRPRFPPASTHDRVSA